MVIPPGQQQIKKVEVAAANVGLATLRLRLVTPDGAPLPAQATVYIQATHYGTLALVIIGTALGIFVLTSVTRAVRRRRRAPPEGSLRPGSGGQIPVPRPSRRRQVTRRGALGPGRAMPDPGRGIRPRASTIGATIGGKPITS